MGQPALDEPALNEEELYYTDMSVGEILRRTRTHYGQSLADIERALHIRASQIEAIEKGSVEHLPGRVYAIGFVRSYSEYLGLDGDKMVHLFKAQAGGKTSRPELDFPVAASDSKTPPVWIVAASFMMAVLILAGWWGSQSRDRTLVNEIPEVPEELKAEMEIDIPAIDTEPMGPFQPEDVAPAAGDAYAVDASPPVAAQQALPEEPVIEGILLNITENSWVEIRDQSGNALVSRVLQAGDQYFVPDRPDLSMSLGNAGGVQLEVDGQPLRPLGAIGEIRRDISLDANALKTRYALPQNAKTVENPLQ